MASIDHAMALADLGFWVFPLKHNAKTPLHEGWQDEASRDPETIRSLFKGRENIGISTSKFMGDKYLLVVDVDTKNGKNGEKTLFELDILGLECPVTREHSTPTGGRHLIYVADTPLRQGSDVFGEGLDVRAKGGYIVAPGSILEGKAYEVLDSSPIAPCPQWISVKLGTQAPKEANRVKALPGVDSDRALNRALVWIATAPLAVENASGDATTFKVASKLKDFGCSESETLGIMLGHWNDRCSPPWMEEDLEAKVRHAYKYGREPIGVSAPEAVFFEPVEGEGYDEPTEDSAHPFEGMNKEFSLIKKGGFVLQETTDYKGNFATDHLSLAEFHAWFANVPFQQEGDKKPRKLSDCWMEWSGRRQYEGVVFAPEQDPGPRWYNLWRGFTTGPADSGDHPAVEAFKAHALENVCNGDQTLYNWLMGYFAHMIQKPWEKPLVALVFKGRKGTGKNALVERVGHLFKEHFLVADDSRYLLGNFNSHLESNLFFVLDEAAWAGDKKAEGKLKGLITGTHHNIERKGKEPYRIENLTRIAIIGNEEWLVPATQDERRFAVFCLGEGKMQDRAFFQNMREGMEQGGYAHLLKFLQDFDLSTVDVNDAPKTQALIDQKHASLDTVQQWWLDCLHSGSIAGGDWAGEWPESVPTNRLREALARWARSRNIKSRLPEEVGFGRIIKHIAPGFTKKKARRGDDADSSYSFFTPGLKSLRREWEAYIGGRVEWED